MPSPVTVIFPYYCQPEMLQLQVGTWESYPREAQIILVDDGSPMRLPWFIDPTVQEKFFPQLRVYRILVDIPWNREQARNLGAQEAQTDWIIQLDLDHLLPKTSLPALVALEPEPGRWYRFPRYRRGAADTTRMKDRIPRSCQFGEIHPHVDSYLVQREVYWQAGGYDEDFAGVLGGGGEFLARLEREAGPPLLLPPEIALHVVTRHVVEDASMTTLSRDTAPGKAIWRKKQAQGLPKPTSWLRQPWERVL